MGRHNKKETEELLQAVRQAVYHISRGNPIPKGNALLHSPIIALRLKETQTPDTVDNRHAIVEEVLRELVNKYGVKQPEGKREQDLHKKIFDLLFHLLQGQPDRISLPQRTYDRLHSQAIKILAKEIQENEQQILHKNEGSNPKALEEACRRADDALNRLKQSRSDIDFFILDDIEEAATVIESLDYPERAKPYFETILNYIERKSTNKIILSRKAHIANKLAHCLMNSDDVLTARALFANVANVAIEVRDWELWLHGIHMLGVTSRMAGEYQAALDSFDKVLANVTKGSNYKRRIAWTQRDKVAVLIDIGDFRDTPHLLKTSLSIREALGEEQSCMMTLEIWGRALIAQQEYRQAENKLHEALSLARSSSSMLFRTILFVTMARLYYRW